MLHNANYPEAHNFKDVMVKFINEINGILNNLYSDADGVLLVSNTAAHLFGVISESNYQIIFSNGSMLRDLIEESLLTHMFFDDNRQPDTYKELDI